MARILVGTTSWADPSLIKTKRFYPKDASKPEPMLQYHATRFPMVEVDSSYYALPSSVNAQKWAERTPDDFTFNIKAYRLLTATRHHASHDLKTFMTRARAALR